MDLFSINIKKISRPDHDSILFAKVEPIITDNLIRCSITKGSRRDKSLNGGPYMYQNPMEIEKSDNQKKRLIVENNVTLLSRLGAILLPPAIIAMGFIKIHAKGHNTYPFSLEHVLGYSVIAGPFAFFISYKLWKALGTKVILTDQKIIKKTTSGKEQHLNWSEIKRINITKNADNNGIQFVFYTKQIAIPFNNAGRIFCPPGALFNKTILSEDATRLILKKIDLYKIPVKGHKKALAVLFEKSNKSLQGQARPSILHTDVSKIFRTKPSSSQTPTPK
jgi:hypothetical protein